MTKNDERSQATGSKGLLPKDEETMQKAGISKDTAKGLMKAAVGNPLPFDDDEDFKDLDGKASGKDLDGRRITGAQKDLEEFQYGKAGDFRRQAQRIDDSDDGEVGISPDQNRGQATDKDDKKRILAEKIDGKDGKPRKPKRVFDDED